MSENVSLEAEAKAATGTGAARAVRRDGRTPGIVYGGGGQPAMITVETRILQRYLNQPGFYSRLWDLKVDGASERVIAREVQVHPVTDRPLHIDFLRVAAGSRIEVAVPVQFVNEERSPGLRRGGLLNVVRHEVDLVCPADAIPDHITVDLAGRDINDSIHISAVSLPEGVSPAITDRDFTIATIAAPTVVTEEAMEAQPTPEPGEVPATEVEEGEGEGEQRQEE